MKPPVVLHSPHASPCVPEREAQQLSISQERLNEELLRMTDWYTDELFAPSVPGAVHFAVSQLVVDPERFSESSASEAEKRCRKVTSYRDASTSSQPAGP
jgi:N-formylglutamate amidohydrolase